MNGKRTDNENKEENNTTPTTTGRGTAQKDLMDGSGTVVTS